MLGLVLAAAIAAPGADPDPKHLIVAPAEQAKAKGLVEKLASPAYEDREKAQTDLAAMGRLAMPALADALARNPSPEVRARCQAIYPRARAEDLQARLDTFVADKAAKFEHELPGWADFRTLTVEDGGNLRGVFADMVTLPIGRELILGDLSPQDLGMRIAARKQELYNRRFAGIRRPGETSAEAPVAEVLALMYAETRVPSRHIPRTSTGTVVYTMPGFVTALSPPSRGDRVPVVPGDRVKVYRAIAGKWVATRDEALLMTQALSVGTTLELSETAGLGARMLKTVGVTTLSKAQAVNAMVKYGNPKHVSALEAVFKDESVVSATVVVGGKVAANALQMRDVGLLGALLLAEEDPREYGFLTGTTPASFRQSYTAWQLPADHRAAAFEKWAAWRAANPEFGKQ